MKGHHQAAAALLAALAITASPAAAQTADPAAEIAATDASAVITSADLTFQLDIAGTAPVLDAIAPDASAFDAGPAVDESTLGKVTGREDIATLIAQANQRNTVSNNSVNGNSVTGAIAIDGNAFQNLQGLAVISANSGNNVAINSAMNVTINMAPPQ
jgi:hypothetical protein